MANTDIREGFLCPICLKDLGTVTQLQSHFEESHSSEDKAVFQQLKGLFDKAKKKILKAIDDEDDIQGAGFSASVYTSTNVGGYDPSFWEPQEIGEIRSHTDTFKSIRDARIDRYVIETNKLLIRLDKLIANDAPTEPNKRKAFEKSVVPWIRDGDVPFCVTCGRPFTLTRRRHHCRLCGGIMCDRCSQFLPYSYGKKLTNPSFTCENEAGFLRRSDSNSSLNSIMSPEGEPHLRTCDECRKMLERRDQLVEMRNTKPTIVLLYDKMKSCLDEAEQLLPRYNPMVESLCLGEATYAYFEAQKLRVQLLKLFEAVDVLSKKILKLGMDAADLPSPKQTQLQKSIRVQASSFLQDNMLTLQSLPSEEEYSQLQEIHKAKVQKRIAAERQEAMQAQERERRKQDEPKASSSNPVKDSGHKRSDSRDSVGTGWKPHEEVKRTVARNADDPMIQQMDIIRGYIKQAKQAMKFDEVDMLEQNLKELQTEYWRQQGAESFQA